MLKLTSRVRIQSKLDPDVFYNLKKMTDRRRINLRLSMQEVSEEFEKANSAVGEFGPLPYLNVPEENLTDEQKAARLLWFNDSAEARHNLQQCLNDKVYPIWVKWGLLSIDGIDVDEEKITGDNACELLPSESGFYDELVEAIQDQMQLGVRRSENLSSPTTSSAAVDGQITDTTAPTANASGSTALVTVESISPAK